MGYRMAEPVIEVRDLVRKFGNRTVLNGISFTVEKGDTMIIMGGSGCGKSTLLRHIIGSLKPTSGSIKIFGRETTTMPGDELEELRKRFGMNFQFGALLQSLTVGENVALPLVEKLGRIFTAYYFLFFLLVMPVVGWIEKPKGLPGSITEAVLGPQAAKPAAPKPAPKRRAPEPVA